MSLCFANQWISSWLQARPQLLLPVDPSETHTYTPPCTEDRKRSGQSVTTRGGSEEKAGIRSKVRVKVQGNDQETEPECQIFTEKKETLNPAAERFRSGASSSGGILSIGTQCDFFPPCLLPSRGSWDGRGLWDTLFPAQNPGQETSPAFLGGPGCSVCLV